MNTLKPELTALLDTLLAAKNQASMAECLNQLLTPTELEEVAKRLQIITMLEAGMPQRKIAEQLGVGIATVSRGARALKQRDE